MVREPDSAEEHQFEIPAIGQAQGIGQNPERQGQRPINEDKYTIQGVTDVLAVRDHPRWRQPVYRLDPERARLDVVAGAWRVDHRTHRRHAGWRGAHPAGRDLAAVRADLCRDLPQHSAAGADVLLVLRAAGAPAAAAWAGDQADGPAVGQFRPGADLPRSFHGGTD